MSSDEHVVSLQDIEVHFETDTGIFGRDSDIVKAVDGVSLDIEENDVVALVGESGCGKTTLGKTAIGVQRPTEGQVEYRGQDIWEARDSSGSSSIPFKQIRQSLQIIHQDPGASLNPNKTVMHTLSVPLRATQPQMTTFDRRERIHEMLSRVGMEPPEAYSKRYPHQLSGGEKQRVALIRALLMNPDLILADEAVSALDVSLRIDMMDLMLELQDQFNTSYLFISHNLSNASYVAGEADGRIGIMYLGELVELGPVDEIVKNPKHPYTKALMWAAPSLDPNADADPSSPLRTIDVPDPRNPPSGCRFHTRCPEAREACKNDVPGELAVDGHTDHTVTCFREDDHHDYWHSPELDEVSTDEADTAASD
ncbi:oligopeptide transport ATP-binding protein AppF [Haloarcula mannanilytica]|uniref:Oligopeptide transport ATP-binding protein AppF n=1 Tax=Haloarcula mannanilytica TaxID=2509225 RepID=A0A4C2EID3_9EURY|nr:ABC transporter ATP-binding protein [Haloarcula mannanilytica]GCF14145.1 oligopeptide transport ATP-binding protein AppF [Haloarcula mannanilytica]